MKFRILFSLLLLMNFCYSQKIKLLSSQTKSPIEGILLIKKNGEIVAKSDINGEIEKSSIATDDYYLLNHPTIETDTLFTKKITNNQYLVKQVREFTIPEVKVQNSQKKYVIVRGYFNSYVTNNGEFNIFVDGIMEFVFDRETDKLKDKNILEYRTYNVENKKWDGKEMGTFVFDQNIKLPELKKINNLSEEKNTNKVYNSVQDITLYETNLAKLENKEFKLFKFVFTNFQQDEMYQFQGTKTKPTTLTNYSITTSLKLKLKTENDFSTLVFTSNFYPSSLSFKDKNEWTKGVNFDRKVSNYKTKFWEEDNFAKIYQFLSTKFKNNFVESKNINY